MLNAPPWNIAVQGIICIYAQSNSPQIVGRLCMRVLDRTKKVLKLVYPPTTPATLYEGETPSGGP